MSIPDSPTKIDNFYIDNHCIFRNSIFLSFFSYDTKKKKIQIEYWLVLFIVILVITTLINHSYAFTENTNLLFGNVFFSFVYLKLEEQITSVFLKFLNMFCLSFGQFLRVLPCICFSHTSIFQCL